MRCSRAEVTPANSARSPKAAALGELLTELGADFCFLLLPRSLPHRLEIITASPLPPAKQIQPPSRVHDTNHTHTSKPWQTRTQTPRLTRRPSPPSSVKNPSKSTCRCVPTPRISKTATSCVTQTPHRNASYHKSCIHLNSSELTRENRAIQSAQLELERQQASDSLRKGLEKRPEREELIERMSFSFMTHVPDVKGLR